MDILGIGVSLVGGWLGKRAGKSERVGGKRPAQKILAPIAAVASAAIVAAATGQAESAQVLLEAAGETGAKAVALYTVAKNAWQLLRS